MRLTAARIQKYRSIRDTGWFDVEPGKTILVGTNEAGKSAVLQALQKINPPPGVPGFDPLRDYPRSEYHDIATGTVEPSRVAAVSVKFALEEADISALPPGYSDALYVYTRDLDNHAAHALEGGPGRPVVGAEFRNDMTRMALHADARHRGEPGRSPSSTLAELLTDWTEGHHLSLEQAGQLREWLDGIAALVHPANTTERGRYDSLLAITDVPATQDLALKALVTRRPVFVLYNDYFRVRPLIHLEHLAARVERELLDDAQYDYGNYCLLRLLGFSARELSDLGRAAEPSASDRPALMAYRDQLDRRSYQVNAASVRLSKEIRDIWNPNPDRGEADRLRVQTDGQYLKVVVEDDLGVEIELDQRSEGFQWLVSFFIVFFAEAMDKHANAILLLDEPGFSLHGLKQKDFRATLSKLAAKNQTIFTTHSPFLVGPDELELVRVVEMRDRAVGTKVHTTVTATDPASLLPVQEALGYELAQSLFGQQCNLVLERLTDYWYMEATAQLVHDGGGAQLDRQIAMLPAATAGKVAYFATVLHANGMKVAALLDSDAAGDRASHQDELVNGVGNQRVLRTKDAYVGPVADPEVEDLLRDTLISIARTDLGWDVTAFAGQEPKRPIVEILTERVPDFSRSRLAKAYLRWCRSAQLSDLTEAEQTRWASLITTINRAFA